MTPKLAAEMAATFILSDPLKMVPFTVEDVETGEKTVVWAKKSKIF